jgi:hypothetical protein
MFADMEALHKELLSKDPTDFVSHFGVAPIQPDRPRADNCG